MRNITVILSLILSSFTSLAQVSIAPTGVYIGKNGVGELYITNNSETSQEISINFQYGYPAHDLKGALYIVYDDTITARTSSLDPMVKAFPKTFVLPPKKQQLVRLQVRAPKGLAAGMYFTRLKITSSGSVAEIGTSNDDGGINTRLNMRFEQVIAAYYKHGTVTTGLVFENIEAKRDSNFMSVIGQYRTLGNAPYIGRLKVSVYNSEGTLLAEGTQSVAMYFSGKRVYNFQMPGNVTPGVYTIEFKGENSRNDMDSQDIVQAPPYTLRTKVQVE